MGIKKLNAKEKELLREICDRVSSYESEDKTLCPIAVLPSDIFSRPYIRLYENRIECDDGELMYMLNDSKIKVECFISGDVQYTTDVSGGVMWDGYSAGVTTRQVKHDSRKLIFRVEGPDGVISFSENFAIDKRGKERKSFQGQYFYDKMLAAISSYKKNKQIVDKKYSDIMKLKKAYYKILNEYEYTLPANLLPKDKDEHVSVNNEKKDVKIDKKEVKEPNSSRTVRNGLLFCSVGLVICWMPLLSNAGIAASFMGVYCLNKIRKEGNEKYKNKVLAGMIMGGIGLAIETILLVITVYAFIRAFSGNI